MKTHFIRGVFSVFCSSKQQTKRKRIIRKALAITACVLAVFIIVSSVKQALGGGSSGDNASADETAQVSVAKQTATAELSTIVDNFASPYGSQVGVVVEDLDTGGSASVNADQTFVSASSYKLFVAYNVYKKIDADAITYNQTLGESVDYQTVESCLNRMITISDNDCGWRWDHW